MVQSPIDRECDVLVVGTGIGGIAAALSAHEQGARVLVIDKGPRERAGGSTRLSGGAWRAPRDTYTAEDQYADVMLVTKGRAEPAITRRVTGEAQSAIRWLENLGMRWVDPEKDEGGSWRPDLKARRVQLHYAPPEPFELGGVMQMGFGHGAINILHRTLFERVPVAFETKAEELLVDRQRRIKGLRAYDADGGYVEYSAPTVVLATGGFQANTEWRVKYFGRFADEWIVRGSRLSTGDGIRMAMDLGGAATGQWGDFHTPVIDARSARVECGETNNNTYPFTLMINKLGKRFVDEGEDYRDRTVIKFGKEVLFQPGSTCYLVYDQKVSHLVGGVISKWPPFVSDDLAELASQLDVDGEQMLETIAEYNSAVQPGEFDPIRLDGKRTAGIRPAKSNWAQSVDSPPFYAYPVTGAVTYGFGGIKTGPDARVIDTEERPIEGLYAAGEMVGGLFYHAYPSGSSLISWTVLGREAGRNAAMQAAARNGTPTHA